MHLTRGRKLGYQKGVTFLPHTVYIHCVYKYNACAGDGEEMSVDLLTCGSCRQQFPLAQFLQFVWHKVIGCDNRSRPSTPRRDDVIADRPYDVRHSPQQPPPRGEDDVSCMMSRAVDVGKFRASN